MRKHWDEYFMDIAKAVGTRSTCTRRQVGAVVVKDHNILATGYNGSPKGTTHCEDRGGCLRQQMEVPSGQMHELCYGAHAEANAIAQAASRGTAIAGSIIYCTTMPCSMCAKAIINSGIVMVVYNEGYADGMANVLFTEAGVELVKM